MATKHTDAHCEPAMACGYIATDRNRFFTGKFMTARDFRAEQKYFLSRHRLHNRLLHGWGIVCGLRVTEHPDPECRDSWVMVGPGVAIDCCGRELILQEAMALPLLGEPASVFDYADPTRQQQAEQARAEQPVPLQLLVCLSYDEQAVEQVPVMDLEGGCDPDHQEANRIREGVRLQPVPLSEVKDEDGCWPSSNGDGEPPCCRSDCDTDLPGPAGICLEPECPCGDCVPLALVRLESRRTKKAFSEYQITEIDTSGRRELPLPPQFLTHISGYNWPHGGEVTMSELETMDGRLEIHFDRKLLPADGDCTGVNRYTFDVTYGGVQQHIELLPAEKDPELANDGCTAVFFIDKDYRPGGKYSLAENTVYIALKCDFVLDCHGNPVDGNHLRGLHPTGNGTPGGIFESWFRVVHDTSEERKS